MRSGLIAYVYRNPLGDCTNGGATSRAEEALLVLDGGGPFDEAWAEKRGVPLLKVVKRKIAGQDYYHAEPVDGPPEGHAGWMAGGNFVYTSDSRFPIRYPLSVHDRSETWAQYERNFD